MAASERNLSAKCLRYKDMDFPFLDDFDAYLKNKYDKDTNPQVR